MIIQIQAHVHFPNTLFNNFSKGLAAVIISSILSGLTGIYFEKVLKSTTQNIWIRNIQLGLSGIIFGFITLEIVDNAEIHQKGFFSGYDWIVCIIIFLQSFGGLMVAIVVKYADNILKGYATSCSLVISCFISVYVFHTGFSIQLVIGTLLVIIAVLIYAAFQET